MGRHSELPKVTQLFEGAVACTCGMRCGFPRLFAFSPKLKRPYRIAGTRLGYGLSQISSELAELIVSARSAQELFDILHTLFRERVVGSEYLRPAQSYLDQTLLSRGNLIDSIEEN